MSIHKKNTSSSDNFKINLLPFKLLSKLILLTDALNGEIIYTTNHHYQPPSLILPKTVHISRASTRIIGCIPFTSISNISSILEWKPDMTQNATGTLLIAES